MKLLNLQQLIYIYFVSVRGYLPAPPDSQRNMMDVNVEQETLRELASRKQNLLLELKNYEANQKASLGSVGMGKGGHIIDADVGMIPAQTQLQTALAINLGTEGKAVSMNTHSFSAARAALGRQMSVCQ